MKTRILTSAALLPLLPVLFFAPRWLFLLLAASAVVRVTWEAVGLFVAAGRPALPWPACAAVALVALSFYRPDQLPLASALAFGTALIAGSAFLVGKDPSKALDTLGASLSTVLLPGLLLSFQVGLRGLGEVEGDPRLDGPALLLYLYVVVFGNDSAAYLSGRLLGRTKLCPSVSPGKTVEGFIGGIAAGIGLGLLVDHFVPTGLGTAQVAGFGFLLAVSAVFGDLSVSLLKRSAGAKDTAALLPGHGGLLDRLDGLLFSSPLLYLAMTTPALFAEAP